MRTCRWDGEAGDYLNDGEPCRVDDYGDPTRHCTARRTCSVHIGRDELTCPRCIGRTRADIRWIVNLAALMPVEALSRGINSEPANLAGPAGDPLVNSWRRIDNSRATGAPIGDGIEETAPTEVLGTWQWMLSEDYGHELPDRITLSTAATYLDRNLGRIANDPEQDWALMVREIRRCRSHLEAALHNSRTPERGVPCPDCVAAQHEAHEKLAASGVPEDEWPKMRAPRLVREYGHWCDEEDCERMHYADDREDRWVCPKDRTHWRTVDEYDHYLAERRGA